MTGSLGLWVNESQEPTSVFLLSVVLQVCPTTLDFCLHGFRASNSGGGNPKTEPSLSSALTSNGQPQGLQDLARAWPICSEGEQDITNLNGGFRGRLARRRETFRRRNSCTVNVSLCSPPSPTHQYDKRASHTLPLFLQRGRLLTREPWLGLAEAELQSNVRLLPTSRPVLYGFIMADHVSDGTCARNSSEVSALQILFYPGVPPSNS